MFHKLFILSIVLCFTAFPSFSQDLPKDSSGRVVYKGDKEVKVRSKKKIMKGLQEWTSVSHDFPPMVFSTIKSASDTLILKGITEVPSARGLHPISFRLVFIPVKRGFDYTFSEFYFEDIKLSLETWLEKYDNTDNKRKQKNAELIKKGLDSHIFLSMNNLADKFNK